MDEFHLGGLAATRSFFDLPAPAPGSRLLDVGSGIGGRARVAAAQYACTVTGIDLTPAFTELATELTARVGLDDRVTFRTADGPRLRGGPAGARDRRPARHLRPDGHRHGAARVSRALGG